MKLRLTMKNGVKKDFDVVEEGICNMDGNEAVVTDGERNYYVAVTFCIDPPELVFQEVSKRDGQDWFDVMREVNSRPLKKRSYGAVVDIEELIS